MLWDGVAPVFRHGICFDFFLVFVVLQRDIELEAVSFAESSLHDCVAGQFKDICLFKLYRLFYLGIKVELVDIV